jgi:quercetin dioxygenase-like cupin family protein
MAPPAPAAPTIRYQASFDVVNAPSEFEPYQAVWDFAPGTWTPVHYHSGPVFVATLEGVVTFHHAADMGPDQQVPAGSTYVEIPNMAHAAGNIGTAPARLLVTNLVPRGDEQSYAAPDDRPVPLPPATRTSNTKFEVPPLRGPFRLIETVLDVPARGTVPALTSGGSMLHTVLDGEVAVQVGGTATTYAAGQTWSVPAGQRERLTNTGAATTRVYLTTLLPRGAQAPTGLPAALPRTGTGSEPSHYGQAGWQAVGTGALAFGLAWLGYMRLRRATARL